MMTTSTDLPTQYHQQDTNYYCGAACAQMILEQCGAGLLDQAGLYNDNHAHSTTESGWYTAPDGLRWTLNNRQSAKYFVLDALDTEDAISRMIVWTIHHYKIAPAALVYGSGHWIVVRGYTTSANPTNSIDTSYTISGFDVNNPWPPTPMPAPPPPHTAFDVCGSGGSRGVADEHISYTAWRSTYMTGATGGHWGGKFVAVCDPDRPPEGGPVEYELERPRFSGEELIDPRQAAELAREALERTGLGDREQWRACLHRTEPTDAVLVQRLDRPDSFYWTVPFTRDWTATTAVLIDARFGTYLQARCAPESREGAFSTVDSEQVAELVFGQAHDLGRRRGRLVLRPGLACISDHWVWRPCRESLSPFYPFKQVTYGAHRLWVRSDGAVFTSLTTTGRGI